MRTILNSGSLFDGCELAHTLGIVGVSVGQFPNVLSIPLCPIYPISPLRLESVMDITILERVSDYVPRALGITILLLLGISPKWSYESERVSAPSSCSPSLGRLSAKSP